MEIVFRAEVYLPAHKAYQETSEATEKAMGVAVANDPLRDLEVKIRYVPIIMDESRRVRYPARSRLERKNRIYNCSPQLAIEPFLTGTPTQRFTQYIGGMRECGPALAKLGATDEQVAAFNRILDQTLCKLTTV